MRILKQIPPCKMRLDENLNFVQYLRQPRIGRTFTSIQSNTSDASTFCGARCCVIRVRAMKWTGGAMVMAIVAATMPTVADASGQQTFSAQCSMCHQPDGAGLPGSFPRLAGRVPQIAGSPDGRRYLATVLLYGLYGPITVDAKPISGMMPAMAALSDQAVADVLNHVLTLRKPSGPELSRKVVPFTAAEIAAVRAGARQTGSQVAAERARLVGLKLIP
jgi:cytochrome c553